ncbi:Uncharacterised protein [Salmonella enterica subsp. enterica serovar Typhi]|nr:Uncharacterised protein [Salmonella enterica subsp. enterica serovar Typhi]CQS65517.1 Uncharacterised protein [Salmonella enterica subsp. enterica serovar Typhi]CQS89651.1 Uncharacterised protein [Salmonella enterica subsp. enterica serovar Typhi]
MNFPDVQFVGGKVGNGFNGLLIGIKSLNQRDANHHFFARGGEFPEIFQHPRGAAIGPLLKRPVGDVFQISQKQIDIRQ